MEREQKFYKCDICGNFVGMIESSGAVMKCCGQNMTEVVPNTTETAHEKHLPVIAVKGDTVEVTVGSVEHPMLAEHYIEWIYLETVNGGQRKALKPGDKPKAVFALAGDKPVAAFAYCNLHGLWKSEIK